MRSFSRYIEVLDHNLKVSKHKLSQWDHLLVAFQVVLLAALLVPLQVALQPPSSCILCSRSAHTAPPYHPPGFSSAPGRCSSCRSSCPSAECSVDSRDSRSPASSISRSAPHRRASPSRSSRTAPSRSPFACSRDRRCTGCAGGGSGRSARRPPLVVCPRAIRWSPLSSSPVALRWSARSSPSLLAVPCLFFATSLCVGPGGFWWFGFGGLVSVGLGRLVSTRRLASTSPRRFFENFLADAVGDLQFVVSNEQLESSRQRSNGH